jgi:uncharacterized protein YprB with RNaseH-like and TPR domain
VDTLLKKQLALIKARAMRLRSRRAKEGDAESAGAADAAGAIVDAVVDTGAVSRGADFVHRPRTRRRWPWPRPGPGRANIDEILAAYKTGEVRTIDEVAPGAVRAVSDHTCWVVTARGGGVDAVAELEASRFARLTAWPEHVTVGTAGVRGRGMRRGTREARAHGRGGDADTPFDPEKVLFLDIETAGLSANTYLFLCGVMYLEGDEWVCEQVFARDYAEETGVLLYIRDLMERFDTVVTYNGQSFDLPFIRTRMAVHRIGDITRLASVDLLHTTRRVFREILPNRRLITVERHLRRVSREGDIPGRYIPDAWHDFVATGDARAMRHVLYHNRMDLFTMAVILTHLSGAVAHRQSAEFSSDSQEPRVQLNHDARGETGKGFTT